MRRIEGFNAAKEALSRITTAISCPVSPALQRKLEGMFGTADPEQAVKYIVDQVRDRGDAAIFNLTEKIDGTKLTSLEVDKSEISKLIAGLKEADIDEIIKTAGSAPVMTAPVEGKKEKKKEKKKEEEEEEEEPTGIGSLF